MLKRIDNLLGDKDLQASDWEKGFLESIRVQASGGRTLSQSQVDILERVEKKNTPEARLELEKYLENWDTERAEIAKVVALYYRSSGYYFQNLCHRVLTGNALGPTDYNKLCENKYALKVVEEHFKEPRFEKGEVVQVRSTVSINSHYLHENGEYTRLNNAHALILEPDALPIRRASKGAKVYRILPFGSQKSYYVSESDLKKARKKKKKTG